jgi:hypothetical protein
MANFDWSQDEYDTPTDFAIIPEGTEVKLKCTEAEDKATSTGGEMIAATFVVVEGEHKGRKIWMNFNTVNKSEKAQNFGRRMIAGWSRASGKPNAKNTDELLDRPFWAKLGIEAGTGQYKDKNIIASFLMPEDTSAPSPKQTPAPKVDKPADTQKDDAAQETPPAKPAPAPASPSKPAAPDSKQGNRKAPWDD